MLDLTANGRVQQRRGNRHAVFAPHGVYPCRGDDRWIAIAVRDDAGWQQLCDVLGHPEWTADARWIDAAGRLQSAEELDAELSQATAELDALRS